MAPLFHVLPRVPENDVVTLSGAVRSRKEKLLAEMIARNTDGIARVDNRLEIDQRS